MVAHEFEFSLNDGISTGVFASFCVWADVDALTKLFCSDVSALLDDSCAFGSSQFILNLVTRGSDASIFLVTL